MECSDQPSSAIERLTLMMIIPVPDAFERRAHPPVFPELRQGAICVRPFWFSYSDYYVVQVQGRPQLGGSIAVMR